MIEIYTKLDCGYCVAAKDLLKINNIGYTEHVINKDISRDDFLEKYPQAKTVPFILIDGEVIGGYDSLLEHVTKKVNNDS